jgi:cytochrome c6
MRKIVALAFFAAALLLYNCAGQSNQAEQTAEAPSGYAVYKKNCEMCHGANGRMGLNGAKPLPDSKMSLEERIKHINTGKGTMQPYKGILSEEAIKAVAEYTMTLGKE